MSSTLITNARMVNEGRTFDGDLRIENGRIAQIGSAARRRAGGGRGRALAAARHDR